MKKMYQQPFMQITAMAQDVVRTSGAEVVEQYSYGWFYEGMVEGQ